MASVKFGATLDGLRRSATEADPAAGARVTRAVERYRAPVRVEVTGRAGVGRSAVIVALGPIAGGEPVETAALDVPGAEDPALTGELIVLVVCDPPRRADQDVVRVAGDRVLVVLNKADTVADRAVAAERAAEILGVPCLPVGARSGEGVDELRIEVAERLAAVRARRSAALLAELRAMTGTARVRDAVEEYLAGDEALTVAALPDQQRDVPGLALQRARAQRGRMNGGFDARSTRGALALHRRAVREWARGELR
ncbi:GTPase domain-containing protein [Rhodococcus sp. NPDC058514]|uniref:GTPase domain-containing protein n=1 Tax=unclassified Rhodococcus (in: high G+C Gram-positive bacteria) TaxID=192944 RepID=UPI00364A79BB